MAPDPAHRRAQVGQRCLLDASAEEEALSGASLWAAVAPGGALAAVGVVGGGSLPPADAEQMLTAARAAALALHAAFDAFLAAHRNGPPASLF